MTGLAQQAHRLVELAREEDDPSAAQLLSLHGAVAARIAAGGLVVAAATASSKAASASAGSAGALVKGLVVSGAIATGAAGFIALKAPPEPPSAPVVVAPRVAPAPVKRAAPPPELAPPPVTVEDEPQAPSRATKAAPPSLRLQDEAALLAEVQGALRGGQPAVALTKLESYDKRFPAGMLRSEADAARVFALCSAGRVDKARAAAARFVQRYPNAPVTARVQAACK
jgi:hypothetical protein